LLVATNKTSVDEGSASVDYLFSPLQAARFAVEQLPGLLWNGCPLCRGITARIGVEYSAGRPQLGEFLSQGHNLILHFGY
jgi:hypothetical protein